MVKRSILMVVFTYLIVFGLVACGGSSYGPSGQPSADNSSTAVSSPTASSTVSLTPVPPHVTGVVVAVSPGSFSSVPCGHATNIVFTAAISIADGSTGGTLPYTWNINHTNIAGSVTFAPGATSQNVTYTLQGFTAQLNAASPMGTITVGDPGNSITSSSVGPSGNCSLPGPFQVVSIAISVSPATVTGITCGSTINVVYTATITIAPNSNAGTVQLIWNLAHIHVQASAFFAPGQTVRTITYTDTGKIGKANGFPRPGSITSTSPNTVSSATVQSAGICS